MIKKENSNSTQLSKLRQRNIGLATEDETINTYYYPTNENSYTEDEIDEARQLERMILKGINLCLRIGYKTAERLYIFKGKLCYKRLGYHSFNEWILASGLPRATLYNYLKTIKDLTIGYDIPIREYEKVDVGKVRSIYPLTEGRCTEKYGARDTQNCSVDFTSRT